MSVLEELRHGIDRVRQTRWFERLTADRLERRVAPALIAIAMLDSHPDLRGLPARLTVSNGERGATVVLRRDPKGFWGLDGVSDKDFIETERMLNPLKVLSEVLKAWGPKGATPQLVEELKPIAFGSDMNDEDFDKALRAACGRISLNAQVGFMTDPVAAAYALQWVHPIERAQRVMDIIERNGDVGANHTDKYGRTLLHEWAASTKPQQQSVEMLVSAGADPNAKDCCGCSPMHQVAESWLACVRNASAWTSDFLDEQSNTFRNALYALRKVGGDPHLESDLDNSSPLSVLGKVCQALERRQDLQGNVTRNILMRDIGILEAAEPTGPKPS